MEIFIAFLSYIMYCGVSFVLKYCYDKRNMWGDNNPITLYQPSLSDIQEDENDYTNKINRYNAQQYVKDVIIPSALYFRLKKDIEFYEEDKSRRSFPGFFIKLFFIGLSTMMLVRSQLIEVWLIALLIVVLICLFSSYIISLIYERSNICYNLRVKHFYKDEGYYKRIANHNNYKISYECNLNNIIIKKHYEYLLSIEQDVIKRYYIRELISKIEFWIYLLFFFCIPEN